MKLAITFGELAAVRELMGAPLSDWKPCESDISPRGGVLEALGRGFEANLTDVLVGPGNLLTYKGEQIVIYIRDTQQSKWVVENEPEKTRRFHISDCSTLREMRAKGRYDRYVLTNNMGGQFLVDWLDRDTGTRGETQAALKVCKNCLTELSYRGYANEQGQLKSQQGLQDREAVWREFSLGEFLMEYSTFFSSRPGRRAENAIQNAYVKDWPRISERTRRMAKWICETCSVDMSSLPRLLHCHHKNGVVTDNAGRNLAVLCAACHAAQPDHGHMRVSSSTIHQINWLRIAQGLPAKHKRR